MNLRERLGLPTPPRPEPQPKAAPSIRYLPIAHGPRCGFQAPGYVSTRNRFESALDVLGPEPLRPRPEPQPKAAPLPPKPEWLRRMSCKDLTGAVTG